MSIRDYFRLDRLIPGALVLCLSSFIAIAATPGVHRSVAPKVFGLHKIEHKIYTDHEVHQTKILELISKARANVRDFYGELKSDPQYIICTANHCKKMLGLKSRGVAHGFTQIHIGPKGVNETILTHELLHAELHKRMGYKDLIIQTIPAWFN